MQFEFRKYGFEKNAFKVSLTFTDKKQTKNSVIVLLLFTAFFHVPVDVFHLLGEVSVHCFVQEVGVLLICDGVHGGPLHDC